MYETDWWRTAVIYQVYPRSFADADGDGVGDLRGISHRLAAIADLGVDAIWISPFYPSPQKDAGYDVSDYTAVDPVFGTLDDFDELLARSHSLGLRVLIDLVPNHTSDQHAWFQAAMASPPGSAERARYHFVDGRGEQGDDPPNNWQSAFGGPAWTRVAESDGSLGQWYLHLFDPSQPDLNWENPEVHAEFERVLRFWLDRGVDGFRVDVARALVKEAGLPDQAEDAGGLEDFHTGGARESPGAGAVGVPDLSIDVLAPANPYSEQPGVHEIFRRWRELTDGYPGQRVICGEAWVKPLAKLALWARPDEMHQVFNFEYLYTNWDAGRVRSVIAESLAEFGRVGAPSTWVLSNHDAVRHASRLAVNGRLGHGDGIGPLSPFRPDPEVGLRRARCASLLTMALPGSLYLYQGEELGLPEVVDIPDEDRCDPTWERSNRTRYGRDGSRVPIPWEAAAPAYGFNTTGASWLPQPEEWRGLARDVQRADPSSTLALYRTALRLRREFRLDGGELTWVSGFDADVIAYSCGGVLVLGNYGAAPVTLPAGYEALLSSGPLEDDGRLGGETTAWLSASGGGSIR